MNYSNFRISLDIHETSSQTIIKMKKGDTGRRIMIALRENSNAYQIEEGCTAVFTAVKPDGNLIYNECAISDNVIIYTITEQTANVLGSVNCEIKLYDRDGVLITSPNFIVYVLDPVFFWGDLPESAPEYTAFREIAAQFAVSDEHIIELIEANSEVFVAQYGVTTLDEIQAAAEGDLACFEKNNESHHILPLVSVAKNRMAQFSGIVSGTLFWVTVTSDGWTSGSESYEKTNTLDENSTDDQIPTAKAVYDLVKENKCVFIAEYGVTTASEVREALIAGKACFAKKEIYYIPLLEADGYSFEFSGFYDTMNYHYSLTDLGWEDNSVEYHKTEEISENSDHNHIPTAKAVLDAIGENANTMVVHIDVVHNEITADKTHAEILSAIQNGKLVLGVYGDEKSVCSGPFDPPQYLRFDPVYVNIARMPHRYFSVNKSNVWTMGNATAPTDEHINDLIDSKKEVFIAEYGVTTRDEILTAYNDGKVCFAKWGDGGNLYSLTATANPGGCVFSGVTASNIVVLKLVPASGGGNEWKYETYPLYTGGPGQPATYFDVDIERTSTTEAEFTNLNQIKEAMDRGMTLVVRNMSFASGHYYPTTFQYILKQDFLTEQSESGYISFITYPIGGTQNRRALHIEFDQNDYANGTITLTRARLIDIPENIVDAYAVSV